MVSIETKINAANMDFINYWLVNGHNAGQAYRKAYPNSTSGQDQSAANLLRIPKIKAEIERRQADLTVKIEEKCLHSKEISINNLNCAYDIALKQANPSGMVAAEREKNAISNLHSATLHTDSDEKRVLDENQAEQAAIIAALVVANANKPKYIESKEIE
jgi:hypothetical protein